MTNGEPNRAVTSGERPGMTDGDPAPESAPAPGSPAPGSTAPAPESRPRSTAARRPMVLAALVLLGAAACTAGSAMTWWTADYLDPLTGPLTLTASGADCCPELVPVALVALAGFGATLASQGWLRRLVGVVLLAGGLLVAVRAVTAMTAVPATLPGGLVRPADPVGPAQLHPAGPILAVAGGVLIAVAGVLVAAGRGAYRRLGARYDAPSKAAPPATPSATTAPPATPTTPATTPATGGRLWTPGRIPPTRPCPTGLMRAATMSQANALHDDERRECDVDGSFEMTVQPVDAVSAQVANPDKETFE